MAFKELSRTEVDELMSAERVVRIGFEANGERYLCRSDSSGEGRSVCDDNPRSQDPNGRRQSERILSDRYFG